MDSNQTSILIIVGMHRSGSSLTASLLQNAGLHIGERLMASNTSNLKGHFENLDFFRFHQRVLQSQAIDPAGWTLQKEIKVEPAFVELAQKLVAENVQPSAWGWKDPRTTLFLDFWATLLPDANFLLVYRSPWEVIDSLYRRSMEPDQIFFQQPDLAPKIWAHYNQNILDLQSRIPERCLLVNIQTITHQTQAWIDSLNQKFQLHLTAPDPSLYEAPLLHQKNLDSQYPSLLQTFFPQVLEQYKQLEASAWRPHQTQIDLSWQTQLSSLNAQESAFQTWLAWRRAEKAQQSLQTQLTQLTQLQTE